MPELPDVELYRERIDALVAGHVLRRVALLSPFVLRSVDPPVSSLEGRQLLRAERIGKRLALAFDEEFFLVVHLMIAGRLRWRPPGGKAIGRRILLASLEFDHGTLHLTEAGTTRRAMLHVVRGREALGQFDRGGLDPLSATLSAFSAVLRSENHTLKRALTDPRLFSGIGNAYSDEILHAARLPPTALTSRLSDEEAARLFDATRETLALWLERLRLAAGNGFPEQVTAFHEEMAVHGRYGQPCPDCGSPIQRIRYASNETNYCARCQTGGRLLADRALSRLLRQDWPRSIDEVE